MDANGVHGGRALFIQGLHHIAPHSTKTLVMFVVRQKLLPRPEISATYERTGTRNEVQPLSKTNYFPNQRLFFRLRRISCVGCCDTLVAKKFRYQGEPSEILEPIEFEGIEIRSLKHGNTGHILYYAPSEAHEWEYCWTMDLQTAKNGILKYKRHLTESVSVPE